LALIADETVLEVKRSVDITEIVSGYIPLKRAGASYKALCPFHDEKTPSFIVTPQRQTFKCFGCGKGGDAISFVMAHENVDYPEAIRILAEKSGIPVKYKEGGKDGIGRDDLYRVLEWAQEAFRALLLKAPEAETARKFLARRGVSDETSDLYKLGFSMDSWDYLLQRGRKAGFDDKTLAAAGLAIEREGRGGYYDRFRGRVVFPIHDPRGRTIGFGARTLKDEQPKFLNSPETAVFSKGRGFYGLHLSKEEIEKTRTVYIVEGYLDVVVPFQAGVKGLVATLGTALTREHLKILRRYADKVVLVFDSDAAGQKASERGLDLLLSENVDIFVASLPEGMDPDDVVIQHGPDKLRECLQNPREIFGFLMDALSARHGTSTPAAIGRIVEEMIERINQIPDPVKQEILVQQLAAKFGIEERTLRGRLARKRENEPAPEEAPQALPAAPVSPTIERAARELLACALADKAVAATIRAEVPPERYPGAILRKIAQTAYDLYDKAGEINRGDLVALLQDAAAMEVAAGIVDLDVDPARAADQARGCQLSLGLAEAKSEYRGLQGRLNEASDDEQREKLKKYMETKGQKSRVNPRAFPGR
jgi:DNA primase